MAVIGFSVKRLVRFSVLIPARICPSFMANIVLVTVYGNAFCSSVSIFKPYLQSSAVPKKNKEIM
ncbi:MAG: hypothetical protein NC344_11460 [Bacteroidales bacterium]|nr:hypothetical protein [Bacteroidales bacterium]MCM1148423.1 hypothetical protein [Bacteroidales bacterium]MCM1207051.1 hypothetical protein [Bacillota bacterium]MCM1510793.1 hypothetical protein [Clostridium sp.]